MGNLPFTAVGSDGTKQEINEFTAKVIATFTANYAHAYALEYTKHLLGDVEENDKPVVGSYSMQQRDIHSLQKPKKTGMLTKRGEIVKNWKHRYFVVKSNYTIEYYENEESFKKGAKPKGTIFPSGYEVVKDMENAMLQRTRKLAEKLGIDVSEIPAPDKYPDYTFELYHKKRRVWIMTAQNKEDMESWCNVFKDCCYHGCGFKNEDPIARKAFPLAMRWTRSECGSGASCSDKGTEEQVLSEFIVAEVSQRMMGEVYSHIKGNWTIKCKIKEQVDKALDSAVMALVTPALKGLDSSVQELKQNLDVLVAQKKDELAAVERKVMWEMNEQIKDHVEKPLNDSRPDIDKVLEMIKDPVVEAFAKCREIFVGASTQLEEKFKEMPELNLELNADEVFHTIDSTYDEKSRNVNSCVEQMFSPLYNSEYPVFPIVICGRDICKLMLDSAVYTFQELFMDSAKGSEAMSSGEEAAKLSNGIKDSVLEQYDCDVTVALHFFLFKSLVCAIEKKLRKELDPICEPLIKPIKEVIPSALERVMSVRDMYEKYVHNAVEDLILKVLKEKNLEPPEIETDDKSKKSKSESTISTDTEPKDIEHQQLEEKEVTEQTEDHNSSPTDKETESEVIEEDQEGTKNDEVKQESVKESEGDQEGTKIGENEQDPVNESEGDQRNDENGEVERKSVDESQKEEIKDDQTEVQETPDTDNSEKAANNSDDDKLADADTKL